MSNIKDIAKLAGVSIATVSRVLNNHPYVNEEKRKKIEKIIKELQYQQNLNAVHLVKGKTLTIGVMIPYIDHPYFQSIVAGIMENAFVHQYSVIFCPTNYNRDIELKYLNMLKRKQIDGMIICSHDIPWETILPFTKFGNIIACEYVERISCVYTDHYSAFLTAIKYLIEKGHRKIGYCTARKDSPSSYMRAKAYYEAHRIMNLPIRESWIFSECVDVMDGKRMMREIIQLEQRPSAILVNGDEVATGMLIQAKVEGLHIPTDISLIGCDNQLISEALELTTIDQNVKEIGKQAFKLVLSNTIEKICIPFEIVERKTVCNH